MARIRTVEVLIDGATNDLTFSYAIPDGLTVEPGQRIRVPLRNRAALGTAIRIGEVEEDSLKYALKPIQGVVSEEPFLTPNLIRLAHWISEFYLASVEGVIRTMLPKPSRGESEKRKVEKWVVVTAGTEKDVLDQFKARERKQREVLEELFESERSLAELTGPLGFSRSSISTLEKKGFVEISDRIVSRDPLRDVRYVESKSLVLNPEQAVVLESIEKSWQDLAEGKPVKPILLFGVTGSGKTEVYLQAIEKTLDEGKGAIVLVPEIALTPQTADRFKQRFAKIQDEVAILHSSLSEGERHDEWRKVLDQKARIVIGARSAIFSPIANLGLIVVDEEHENSYKQDIVPRYQARDIAVVRAHMEKCPVLLGSATPSLESWNNVLTGKYELATMAQRIDDRKLPLIRIIDMRQETRKHHGGGPSILSGKLREAMEARLADGEQTILFLNRRGFARNILCPECGYVANCRHCSTTMTLHRKEDRLVCHICGFSQLPPRSCPECSAKAIVNAGYGTERVEEVLRKVFTDARITRVDTDSMRKKNQLRDTLTAFKSKKIDILLGTQMIAKGLHFPNVTLVGILNADVGLHIPDFRAGERTFQLLTQVAGRAGRGELEGEVIVQTYTPHHPSIQFGRHHDFEGFAEQELAMRRQFGHPPFLHVVLITVRSVHQERAEFSLKTLHARLKRHLPEDISLTEPLPSPLVKSHDQWRYQVLLKSTRVRLMSRHVREVMKDLTFPSDVIVTIDVDPYSLG